MANIPALTSLNEENWMGYTYKCLGRSGLGFGLKGAPRGLNRRHWAREVVELGVGARRVLPAWERGMRATDTAGPRFTFAFTVQYLGNGGG
jgi:hypothetical protein